ncbi:DUF2231 domain-containing protein [Bradyrhizobium canariense]|uniref:Uncharacterized membrane protein n=1 Tax=Bradyrhizobium canariense TaxID=255045 RepID=A0A1H2AWM4_9BRAD|nr:DUF2231 domain-containing protein [Bradyrhizobium canariense]SDT50313.1 Uncharacterized membrane protein [Bradyrhizobium canariense]
MKHAMITEATFFGDADLRPTAKPRGRPMHKMVVSFSAAYFAGAFITDLVYWRIPDVLWERFSIWLITAGLIMAGFAAIAYVIDLAGSRQIDRPAWPRVVGYALAVSLSLINAFVHSRDGYTAVVPTGLMLSGLVVVVLLLTAWVGIALANRHRVGG